MRPVERGPAPRTYSSYGQAIGDLEDRLGIYCSYCERRLPVSLAVEHISPKSLHPDLELDWDNFLLGCTNCNSVKGDTDVDEGATLWPDRDNTILALSYPEGGFVEINDGLESPELRAQAKALISLVGLDRHGAPGRPRPAPRDHRWQQREELWATAKECAKSYESLGRAPEALSLVVSTAKGYGFFSIWMSVFRAYPEVRLALIDAFPGTAQDCFDGDGQPVNRPGGNL